VVERGWQRRQTDVQRPVQPCAGALCVWEGLIASLRWMGSMTETRVFGKRTMGRVVRNWQGR
jgi:hypothetical protein